MGIGSLVCINYLLIAPVGNVLMRLDCQGKGTVGKGTWKNIIVKAILVPGNSFSF